LVYYNSGIYYLCYWVAEYFNRYSYPCFLFQI
jgi:hypothetical protein